MKEEEEAFFPSLFPEERVRYLIHSIKNESGDALISALRELSMFSDRFAFKAPLIHPSLELLPALHGVLNSGDSLLVHHATEILWLLSRNDLVKKVLVLSEHRFFPLLVVLAQTPNAHYQDHIIHALSNIVLEEDTHPLLLQFGTAFFDLLLTEIRRRPDYFQLYKCMAGFVKKASNESVELLICTGLHTSILNYLLVKTLSSTWTGYSTLTWSMSFLLAFSTSPAGARALYESGRIDFFITLMEERSIRGMQAAMTVANVVGQSGNESLLRCLSLESREFVLQLLLDLFDITLDYREKRPKVRLFLMWRFSYGIIQLRDIVSALKFLAMIKVNQTILIQYQLLVKLIAQVLQDFVDDREDYQAFTDSDFTSSGGGGKDVTSVFYVLELVFQLSLIRQDESGVRMYWKGKLFPVMNALLQLPVERQIPSEIMTLAQLVLETLTM